MVRISMVTYKEAVLFVNEKQNTVRCVIIANEHCSACTSVINVLQKSTVPFIILDGEDPELIFKPSIWPQTCFFSKNNNCYSRYDVFELSHLITMLDNIERCETIKSPKLG